jgi:two-component sensor histidine kinase
MTLRHRLSLLVAIALMPPLLLTLYNVVRSQVVLDKEARDEALAAARLISSEFAQLIEGSRQLMVAMAKHPAVPHDEAACSAYFKSVIADIPIYRAAAIIDTDGAFHCSTLPVPLNVDARNRIYFREPMTTGRLTIGPLERGGTDAASLHISTAYRSADGGSRGVIVLDLNPDRMAQDLAGRPWRSHHRIIVLDREGSLVLTIPQDKAEGAKAIAQDVFPRVASASSETIYARGPAGRPEIVGFVPVDNAPGGLFVAVAIDQDVALAEAKQANEQSLAFALITMILAVVGAWLATHILINRPIRAIVDTARRREAGDIGAPFPALSFSTEFGQLSTALSRMSGKIHELLEQKGFLLRELQHRVMNSLTLLSSVLDMQRRHVRNGVAREHLARARDRVVAMATVYRYLYQTDTSDEVEFSGFLKIICAESQNAYAGAHKPTIAVDADRLDLSGSHAISLAMLTHELITNALKHAYPEGQPGPIDVTLKRKGKNTVELRVADRGRGLPQDFQIGQSASLGMRVIASTAQQLGGTLEITRLEPGTEFLIRLPLSNLHSNRR